MDVQSESVDPPPGEPQPAGKIRKGFKLFGKRKPGSIFSIRKGEGNNKPSMTRSKTLDGLTENSEQEPREKEQGEREQEDKAAEAHPGENGQSEEGSFVEDGVLAASTSPPRMSISSTTSVKSTGFLSLLRGGRSRGGGDRRAQTVSHHPEGHRQRRGLKSLFRGVSFHHKDKDGAVPPSPLLMPSRSNSVEIIKEQLGLTPKPQPRSLDDDDDELDDSETESCSDPASRLTPQDSPSTATPSETTAPQTPLGNVSKTPERAPPPVPTTPLPPLEPGETSLSNLLADISSLMTFDSIASGGDFLADVEAEWGKVSPVRAGEKLPLPTGSSKPASPSVSVVTTAKPSCPPATTSTAKPTSVSTFPITQPAITSITTTKPSSSTSRSVKFSVDPTPASESTTTSVINPTPISTATVKPLTVTAPVPSTNYSTPVMSSFSKSPPPFKPAPTTTATAKPFTAPITSTSYSSPVMSSPSTITIKHSPYPASVSVTTSPVISPATVLSTATAKSTPEATPNIVSKPNPVATPNIATSPLVTPSITSVNKPSPEATPNIAMSPYATANITSVNKPSPVPTPNIAMSPVAKPNVASVIKPSPEASPPPTISKSVAVTLSNASPVLLTTTTPAKFEASAMNGSSSYRPNLTPVAAESKAQMSLSSASAVASQASTLAPVASSKMLTCPTPTVGPDPSCAAPPQPKPSPGPMDLTKDPPSVVPTPDPITKARLDPAPTPAPISSTKPQQVSIPTPQSLDKTTTPSFAACLDKMPPERITAPAASAHATVPVPVPSPPLPSSTPTPAPMSQSETPQFKSIAPVLTTQPAPTPSPLSSEPLTSTARVKANGQSSANGGLVIPHVTDSQGGQTVSPKYEELLNESRANTPAPSKERRTLSKIPVVGGGRGAKPPPRDNQHVDDGSDGSLDPPTPVLEEERPRFGVHEAGVKDQIGDSEAGVPGSRHRQEESLVSQPHQAKVVSALPRESKIPVKHGAQPHPASQIPVAKEPPRTKIPVSKVPVRRAGNKPAAAGMSSQVRK